MTVHDNPAYPVELLPTASHIYPLEADSFTDTDKTIMHRRSDIGYEECFYNGVIDRFHFRTERSSEIFKHPYNLSLNLLGGQFIADRHAIWRQTKPGSDYWLGGKDINLSDYSGCYSHHNTAYPDFYFKVSDLHDRPIKYPRTFNRQSESWPYKAVVTGLRIIDHKSGDKKIKGQVTEDVKGVLKLKHRPTNLNYWHWQLEAATSRKVPVDNKE
ncbi:MAG: hypothetical protein K2M03_05025, partial [Muribaculaceae bacterium]|nr:hypothetical protein [Muribaculaceae bacterium]